MPPKEKDRKTERTSKDIPYHLLPVLLDHNQPLTLQMLSQPNLTEQGFSQRSFPKVSTIPDERTSLLRRMVGKEMLEILRPEREIQDSLILRLLLLLLVLEILCLLQVMMQRKRREGGKREGGEAVLEWDDGSEEIRWGRNRN